MTSKLIIALIIFFATLVIKLAVDYRLWLRGKTNRHLLGPIIVLTCLVVCSVLAGWLSTPMWFFGWWAIFDSLYALLIGQKWYYTGSTSKLDKWQATSPALKWLKYVMVPVSIILYVML